MNSAPCVNEELCKLARFLSEEAKRIEFGTITIDIRKHQIIHADVKVTKNRRISLRENTYPKSKK